MATPVYDRAKFFESMTDNDGVVLTNPIDFDFSNFLEFLRDRRVKVRRLQESEEGAPDLVSFQEYGDDQYWWIILLANRIQDPLNEFVAGIEIVIPQLRDIEEFRQAQAAGQTRGEAVILN